MRDNETVEDQLEKELYSKVCVVKSIKHFVGEASKEKVYMKEEDRFSLNLATIIARDDEVVAVRLYASSDGYKVCLFKNSSWTPDDISYIRKVETYLKIISKYSPATSEVVENTENALIHEIKTYCYTKVKSRFEKLKRDIIGSQEGYIKSFTDFASINVNKLSKIDKEGLYKICKKCYMYYKITKRDPKAHPKFLGYLKKMGTYVGSVIEIIACANKPNHKTIFSKFELHKMEPTIIADQPTFS
ncbi:11364_t:CDS:1 [Funneliformis mosseae]|uniref:11364_t:CDS:1 n=1 Tax=Funneliformis mosseae TaxID=27381 RepID=A0A9N9G1R4_FUNMO|nr:11364_t:CDS:1 [Funneliformis mosseae]